MTNLTPWFDPKVDGQPVRVGWYEREYKWVKGNDARDWWNGMEWFYGDEDGGFSDIPSRQQDRPWRGLTEPNEEKQ